MKVYFHELKDHETTYSFNETTPWIMEVIGSLDERMDQIKRPPNWKPRSRPTEVTFSLRRIDDLVHVTAKVKTQLYLLCSLCADAFHFPINTQFHILLTQSDIYAETPREMAHQSSFDVDDWLENDEEEDEDEESAPPMNLNSSDYEVSVVTEPVADLKEILHEQITLTLPMQPKPDKDEKGDCNKCGRSQIAYSNESEELVRENPFAVLKNFKKKSDTDS